MLTQTFILFLIVIPAALAQTSASTCGAGEWRCAGGACIPAAGRCNGTVECADSSDEAFPTCRTNRCSDDQYRCTYGACVNVTSQCDDKRDCADNSDELLPICRNDVDSNICKERIIDGYSSRKVDCVNSRDTCDDGEVLGYPGRCNGRVDCRDGSDETLATCADAVCKAPLFRCAYGGCAHRKAICDGERDCADGSDELDELCRSILTPTTTPTTSMTTPTTSMTTLTTSTTTPTTSTTTPKPVCTLPQYPDHGTYKMGGFPDAVPGQTFDGAVVFLNVTCDPGYGILGADAMYCFNGLWSTELPRCVRFCKLPKHPSVKYYCVVNTDTVSATRDCEIFEPDGTTVEPRCNEPVYHYPGVIRFMQCDDGSWNNVVTCTPDCGKMAPVGDNLLLGGAQARLDELPWNVAIYRKKRKTHICGGTIVTNTIIITAAQCFWDDVIKLLPAARFVVAAGTVHRTWRHPDDVNGQFSDVREIRIPERFQGAATNYQDDIALVKLSSALEYTVRVRPACLDFDYEFDSQQLQVRNMGKVAGWGLTASGDYAEVLHVAEVPYITVRQCIADAPPGFKEYITSDKICAGAQNGTALCRGDGGGGLVFPEIERGIPRYYLRGVASTAIGSRQECIPATVTSFTHPLEHEEFIKEYII